MVWYHWYGSGSNNPIAFTSINVKKLNSLKLGCKDDMVISDI